jgi:hypothetical protein
MSYYTRMKKANSNHDASGKFSVAAQADGYGNKTPAYNPEVGDQAAGADAAGRPGPAAVAQEKRNLAGEKQFQRNNAPAKTKKK